jgi:host factor-I protein
MPPTLEPPQPPLQPNIQDVFLNHARRERLVLQFRLMDGTDLEGLVKNFDRYAVVIEREGGDLLIFKHAIATIKTPRAVANYFASHQP